jgi:hypothetical protein
MTSSSVKGAFGGSFISDVMVQPVDSDYCYVILTPINLCINF